jgi:uncharacterized membrane protein YfcA
MLLLPLTMTLWLAGFSVREREATYLAVLGHPVVAILALSILIGLLAGLVGWSRSHIRTGFKYTAILCILGGLYFVSSVKDTEMEAHALQPLALLGIAFAACFFGSGFLLVRYFLVCWNRPTVEEKLD